VHILVGEEQQDFSVHKDLICHHSPYFKAAFNLEFDEAKTGTMKLPEISVEIFQLFLGWLYTQKLRDESMPPEQWRNTNDLMKLYVFADTAKIATLKNVSISPSLPFPAQINFFDRLTLRVFPKRPCRWSANSCNSLGLILCLL
jgi:hypothetical protein